MYHEIVVGIPTLNGPERLDACLTSIFKTHDLYKGLDIKILVLDDCSSEDNLEKNKEICSRHGVDMLMHSTRMGVARAWNDLTRHFDNKYVILINDDVQVVHNWIDVIKYTLENNPELGVVGLNAFEGGNSKKQPNNVETYIEARILLGGNLHPIISARGFAFGFRRDDYNNIGGFDERYFCFFEEIDFNLSMMLKFNKRNCILSHPIVIHAHGATTFENLINPSEIFKKSKELFELKWVLKWENIREKINYKNIPIITSKLNEWNSNINIWG